MDVGTITDAYNGLKIAKDVFVGLTKLKSETDSLEKIHDAVTKVGEAQDALFNLREELFRLQEENQNLKKTLNEKEEWRKRIENYELVETAGGAVVYKSKEGTNHYICPSCLERTEVHILQNRRVASGTFDCPGCDKTFPVNPFQSGGGGRRVISKGLQR